MATKDKEISFIPLGSYSIKLFGIALFVIGLGTYILSTLSIIQLNVNDWLPQWLIVSAMTFYNFSREKQETTEVKSLRYIAFKTSGIFIIGFILSIELISLYFKADIAIRPLTIGFIYNLFFGMFYLICLIYPKKYSNEDISPMYIEQSVGSNRKILYIIWFILTVSTLILINWLL